MGNPFELKMTYFVHFSNILYNRLVSLEIREF